MSQHDLTIDNQGFPSFRSDLNNALQALGSVNSGATAPSTTFAYQLWADTANDLLKQRNAANTAWVDVMTLSTGVPANATLADLVTKGGDYSTLKSGRKNLIINGDFAINQRGQTSGAVAVDTSGYYTLDRWKLANGTDTISWTGTYGKTVTAPANGITQIIEGLSFQSGTYVISWTGTATCTVDTVSKSSGDTFTLTEGTNCTVKFSGGTVSNVQVELGSTATSFEKRSYGEELALCQRYYEKSYNISDPAGTSTSNGRLFVYGSTDSSGQTGFVVEFKQNKRTAPTMSFYTSTGTSGSWSYGISGSAGTATVSTGGINAESNALCYIQPSVSGYINIVADGHWVADAEL